MRSGNSKKEITFGEIALALARDYNSIYVIDSGNDSYVEYLSAGNNDELEERSSGDDFYSDTIRNTRVLIHPEDQERFLNAFKKENVLNTLKDGRSFSINYRLLVNGDYRYYYLKTIKGDDDRVLIGVRDVDEQMRKTLLEDQEILTYRHIAGVLADRCEVIYYVNIQSDEYMMYSSSADYAKLGTTAKGNDFFADAASDIKKYVHKDDVKAVLKEISKERLLRNLKKSGAASLTYRQQLGDGVSYVTMNIVRPRNDDKHIVIGVMNIDEQVKHEQSILEESRMFNDVALALASRYEVIYRVNIKTGSYYEYSASDKYKKLEVGNHGEDFFGDSQRNMKRDIYEEDYPMMAETIHPEVLLQKLEGTNKVYLNYRLNLDGRPQYVSLVIMRVAGDADHIIVALENIDEAKKRELEFEAKIGSAIDMANRDSLTGVKNKHAYVTAEDQLDSQIGEEEEELEFAITICDINGLKQVNDQQGHSAGDQYIKDACKIICNIFDHSPVFRIGGDEFVVILKGRDYENRHDLLKQLYSIQVDNKRDGLVTLAYGMAEYERDKDLRVQDVFERADNLMYANKKRFKDQPLEEMAQSAESYSFVRFYELYEQLLSAMVNFDKPDGPLIKSLLAKIGYMFRLSKGVIRVYRNPTEEAEGAGETFIGFDNGKDGYEILSLRVVTSVMTSATATLFMSPDEEPLSSEEYNKIELVARTILSFISRNRMRDVVYELAYFDESGYPNLRYLNQYLVKLVRNNSFGDMMAFRYNLRHFSLVNNEYGRETGDKIMKAHYAKLKEIVGEEYLLARLGGDNFVGICPKDRINDVTGYLFETLVSVDDDVRVKVATSAGILCGQEGVVLTNPGDIMGKIINAYRVAQGGGKDRIIFYDEGFMEKREVSMRIQQMFSDALAGDEFRPFYQPKVNITNGELCGAEALCRWFRDGRIVPPMEFIPVLEQTNDICKLDLYMLERVCKDLRKWLDEGREVVRISINFSRKHFSHFDLVDTIVEIIDRYDIPHEYIEVELTETTTDVSFSDLKRIVRGLQEKGISTSVDDFGIGYSSLNLIRDIPWNTIKIDRSFLPVEGEEDNGIKNVMFRSVVSMVGLMGLECITEGVETPEQLRILRENSCDIVQGFYFDKPLPVEVFESRLQDRFYKI